MNFLAHIYLSGDNTKLKIGNFIGDFLRGSKLEDFDEEIQRGIRLHRAIDLYTDNHDVVMISKKRLWDKYRHFSGVIVDIYYDHFLARNWDEFHGTSLEKYVKDFYDMITSKSELLPNRVNEMMPHMIRHNWLENYQHFEGIEHVMMGMSRRTKHESNMEHSVEDLKEHYEDFEGDFYEFFPDLERYVQSYLEDK